MKPSRILLKALVVLAVIQFHIGNLASLHAKPYTPKDDTVILETLPRSSDTEMRNLRQLRAQLSQTPNNLKLAVHLSRLYFQLGRSQADPRYDGYAQSALEPWWNMPQPPIDVLILRATLRQRRHDFDRALQDLRLIITPQPNHAQAWLTKAVIHQVRGDYQQARHSCLPLLGLTNTLVSTACIANVTSLNGQAHRSYQVLENTVLQKSSSTSEEKLWASTLLAEIASRLGMWSEADHYFQLALSIDQDDSYLLGAYSDFLLDRGRPAEVHTLLQKKVRSDGLLLRLALAEQTLKASTVSQHIDILRVRFSENRLRGEARHLREEARFTLHLLHQPQKALTLALENWKIQCEPADARLVLEAALYSRDRSAAQPVLDWLTAKNLEDVALKKLKEQLS